MKIRTDINSNYRGIFFNGKTIRQRINPSIPISAPTFAEIEDVAINSKCYANCSYCYTSATNSGVNFENIVDKALKVWGEREENDRPFQIAIGGLGESTLHPDWISFVKVVNELGIMPNYTTNGMHLSNNILQATEKYCGGVAVSYHPHIENVFYRAVDKLSTIKTKLNCHVIIGTEDSLSHLKDIYDMYYNTIDYFVILPYQAVGRGKTINCEDVWYNTFEWISTVQSKKFAFGALFYEYFKRNNIQLDIDIYEPEIYSGFRIFDDSYLSLRNSSYDLSLKK